MLTLGTHKIYKITSLTADSYKQLFALITMLLTVLSVQQSAFAMAAPLPQQSSQQPPLEQQPVQQHNLPPQLNRHQAAHHNLYDHYDRNQQQQQLQPHAEIQLNILLAENDHNNHHQLETDIETEERLHKRHTSWHDYYSKTMDSTKVEWYNPCGGQYITIKKKTKAKSKPAVKKALRTLQNATVREFSSLNANQLHSIDIRNMSMWDKFDENYKFLPNMKINSSISLRRYYRQVQVFVASFDYLHRAQLHWDYHKAMQHSETSRELYLMRNNAREILCGIENAINNTTSYSKAKSTIDSLFIPRERMEGMLHFQTDIQHISPLKWEQTKRDNRLIHINPVDLRFVKSYYLTYIRKFIKSLRMTTKRPGPIRLGGRKDQQHKKKQQQGQQSNNKHNNKLKPRKTSRKNKD